MTHPEVGLFCKDPGLFSPDMTPVKIERERERKRTREQDSAKETARQKRIYLILACLKCNVALQFFRGRWKVGVHPKDPPGLSFSARVRGSE